MLFGKFLAAVFGLLYIYFFVEAFSGHTRKGWFFRSVSFSRAILFNLAVWHDLLAGLIYLWISFFQTSFLYGRIVMLWLAHLFMSAAFLGKFEGTDDEGGDYNWAPIGKVVCFVLALYWYYLVLIAGVSLVDVLETIGDILDA